MKKYSEKKILNPSGLVNWHHADSCRWWKTRRCTCNVAEKVRALLVPSKLIESGPWKGSVVSSDECGNVKLTHPLGAVMILYPQRGIRV